MTLFKLQLVLFSLICLLVSSTASAEQHSYLCSAEESTGYDFTNGRWLRERFRADSRFLVKQLEETWSVYDYTNESEHTDCRFSENDILKCSIDGDLIMDLNTMKFSVTDTRSYVHSTSKNRDSVILTLGVCVPMR